MFGPVHVFAFGTSGFLRACELHSTIVGPLETQPRLCSGSRSGKYKAFREDFASVKKYTQEMHDLALAQILKERPEFLLGENTVANLVDVKERLRSHGQEGHAFFLFRIFAQMCGKLGPQSQTGNETQFRRCTPGLKALQLLWTSDGKDCYADFMLLRGSKAMVRFASPEHQALSRLLCLFDAFDKEEGRILCEAFDELDIDERGCLTQWLNSAGACGVVIPNASRMLQSAKKNPSVGLANALRVMVKVREECRRHEQGSEHRLVVQFAELARWAKDSGLQRLIPKQDYHGDHPGEVFLRSTVEVQGDTKVIFLEVEPSSVSLASCAANSGSRPHEMLSDPSTPRPVTPGPLRPGTSLSSASPLRNVHDSTTQTPQRSELDPDGARPGERSREEQRGPRPFCLGRYSLMAISGIWALVALCLGDAELTLSWRTVLFLLLLLAVVMVGLHVYCENIEIPVERISEVHRLGPAEPFLAQWGVLRAASREPQYSRLQTCDDEV
eukprot:g21465.t1